MGETMQPARREAAEELPVEDLPAVPLQTFVMIMLAALGGASAALLILPNWLPGLGGSLEGSAPQAFWFLSRSSAMAAYWLLWLSMALGLMITNKLARLWPGGPVAFDLHQYATLLGLAFVLFHALILLGDRYIHYTLGSILLPFASGEYKPFWVGLGQVGFYLMALVAFSFYLRKRITTRVWRLIHYLSFAVFVLALAHGVLSGSDSQSAWIRGGYWVSAGLLLFLLIYRILAGFIDTRSVTARRAT